MNESFRIYKKIFPLLFLCVHFRVTYTDEVVKYSRNINVSSASISLCKSNALSDCLRCPTLPDVCGSRLIDSSGLQFRGGLHLKAEDFPHFGGFSDLRVTEDGGSILSVSDRGWILSAQLQHDASGRLVGVNSAKMAPLLNFDGIPLEESNDVDGRLTDAEGMTSTNRTYPLNGDVFVSFEGAARGAHK
jgi:hypothetical protein